VPGKVTFQRYDIGGDVGSTVYLRCNHTGTPSPTVNWHSPSDRIVNVTTVDSAKLRIVNGSYLEIRNLSESDAGVYKCFALNQFTYKSMRNKHGSAHLSVFCKQTDFVKI